MPSIRHGLPDDLPIRHLTRGDLIACADLSEDRGWPRDEHRWGLLLGASTGYGIDDPAGKGLAAACVVTSYQPSHAALGMMLVAERFARQGLGRRLLLHVLAEHGETPLTLFATDQGRPLYEGLGFAVVGSVERSVGRFLPEDVPVRASAEAHGSSALTTRRAKARDLPAIMALDVSAFGAERTQMLARLPAFSDHFRVAERAGELVGFAALWPSDGSHVIGPLVAPDSDTAKALVASLASETDLVLRTEIDTRHTELRGWLSERGLAAVSRTAVMTRGCQDVPGDWSHRFAPLTVATG
ncbi:GNAT family N-acetyltransferase [Streptomyces sp. NBC_00102]|uniref:GNAT family N-acetyltransferase n=1 Tax=Streptomyces sp. NBC_00102 TaxID=2975652 RepID=UPI00224DCB39|nr:GNAT family N-acetyltransferase [Streptomyces sp. NBC_00102]MCX5398235.1 GNAT family N-acetyltransferase [Streptomyces sp. NBC_00102]